MGNGQLSMYCIVLSEGTKMVTAVNSAFTHKKEWKRYLLYAKKLINKNFSTLPIECKIQR